MASQTVPQAHSNVIKFYTPAVRSFPPKPPVEPKEVEPGPFEISDDTARDLEIALRSLAFLVDFLRVVGSDELRRCADEVCGILRQR
jgi:hypothetical protein